jgi:hypothetical protein
LEQGYGVCGARDEPAHAGKQQQFVNELGHDVLRKAAGLQGMFGAFVRIAR